MVRMSSGDTMTTVTEPTIDSLGLRDMSPEVKRRLAIELIDSIPEPVSDELQAMLEYRLTEHYADPTTSIPWETVKERLAANRVKSQNG